MGQGDAALMLPPALVTMPLKPKKKVLWMSRTMTSDSTLWPSGGARVRVSSSYVTRSPQWNMLCYGDIGAVTCLRVV